MATTFGLVMTGGGARGAYQAGVLKRLGEIKHLQGRPNPFPIIGGSSAGAINGAGLAMGCDDFSLATRFWRYLVQPATTGYFSLRRLSQARNSITWIWISLSEQCWAEVTPDRFWTQRRCGTSLSQHLDCDRIQDNIKRGHLYALTISATNYNSGKSYLFIQGAKGHPMWNRSRRVTLATKITVDHICASAAIPLVFQPVKLKTARGTAFFGDGCIRLQQPLSPVIRLGARKLFAIGVRGHGLEHQEEAIGESGALRWRKCWEYFSMSCSWIIWRPTSSTWNGSISCCAEDTWTSQALKDARECAPLTPLLITPSVI